MSESFCPIGYAVQQLEPVAILRRSAFLLLNKSHFEQMFFVPFATG